MIVSNAMLLVGMLFFQAFSVHKVRDSYEKYFFIGTTDLQEVNITYSGERYIIISCKFAKGSQARGCHVILKTLTDQELMSMNVTHDGRDKITIREFDVSMFGLLNISQLVVVGFDLEADGTIGEVPIIPWIKVIEPTEAPSGILHCTLNIHESKWSTVSVIFVEVPDVINVHSSIVAN